MMKNIAKRNPNITFIHFSVCDLVISNKNDPDSTRILFDMAKFYFPSVLILDEFEILYT